MTSPLFLALTLLVLLGGIQALRRRRKGGWEERLEREPWARSLREAEEAEGEPLDEEAIRRAEDEFLGRSWELEDEAGSEPWR